jgi:putative transposase
MKIDRLLQETLGKSPFFSHSRQRPENFTPDPGITAALRREGWVVNPKRVYRLLREDNLLCMRKWKFVATTDSNHNRPVYPNLAEQMTLSGINQLWVADITYIRLEAEYVYLAVVIDAFSRRVIGWALDRRVEDDLTLEALRMALELRHPPAGCLHHSDRGSQYASGDYTGLLKTNGFEISMSHKSSPWWDLQNRRALASRLDFSRLPEFSQESRAAPA